ncbi:MAG: hypothetical protein FJY34_03795 [Betaproteobacteria bacterium]|nr:hypothetical protein [Betaproteobacteria bacterium]
MRAAWGLGASALALFGAIVLYLAPLEPGVLQLQFALTPRAFGAVMHFWSPQDLARYRAHLPWDFLLLMLYAAFGWLFARRSPLFAHSTPAARAAAAWLLPAAAIFDAAENALHLWLTAAPRFDLAPLYALSALSAAAKWALLIAFSIVVLRALARR